MGKKLTEMTLEELWQLFPIYLTAYQPCWKIWFDEEKKFLSGILPEGVKIHHIGSTAVGSIWAKPIVDILVEVPRKSDLSLVKGQIVDGGYLCMSEEKDRLSFNKGYTEQGFAEKVFHLHLRYAGDNKELYFKEYLIDHPEVAKVYEQLKLELWKAYEHDRDGYTNAKTEFIQRYTDEAMALYKSKYEWA